MENGELRQIRVKDVCVLEIEWRGTAHISEEELWR